MQVLNHLFFSVCVAMCPDGTYIKDKSCMPCDDSCKTCNGPALTECLTCPNGHTFHTISEKHSICSTECIDGTYLSKLFLFKI